jgi:xylulokinase
MAAGGVEEDVCTKPPVAAIHEPDTAAHAMLQERLAQFRALYRQLKPVFAPR